MGARIRFGGFGLGLVLVSMVAGSAPSALAEIRATDKNGLRTEVNGLRGGRCHKGICRIGGGTNAGKNKFHRFKDFDTRGEITRVEFDTDGKNNLIIGVTSPSGSWINKALSMSSKANLFFLSPGGIYVGKGADFINVPKLTLSTADQLKFSEGVFDVFGSTPSSIQDFRTNPLPGVFGLRRSEIEEPVELAAGELPGIHLDGINISLDEELVVDAPGGRVDVTGSRLNVGTEEIGGRIALTGEAIRIDGESELIASGMFGGGLIEVGGSWQNSDASVRQAISVIIENGALLDASAVEQGDGGEIVVWSDVTDPQSITKVAGTLLAIGGPEGGNGGAIETSGFELNVAGIDVDAKARRGEQGLWLLDPFDYTLDNNSFETSTIATVLSNGTDVTISTASTSNTLNQVGLEHGNGISSDNSDSSGGTITVNDSIVVSGSGSGSLTLIADKDIQINATLQNSTGAGGLTLSSATGVAINSTGSIDWDGGSDGLIQIIASASGGLTGSGPIDMGDAGTSLTISQPSISDTTYSGSMSGVGNLTKAGSGELLLSGANTYQGRTTIEEGVLGISNASALGASGAQSNGTFINRDAALYIIGSENFSLTETLSLGQSGSSGSARIRLISGNATLTKPITLFGDSALEALSGELLLDNVSSSAGSNMIAVDSSCGGEQSCSLRVGGNSLGGGGIVKTFWDQSSPSNSDGINLGSESLTINNNGAFRISGVSTHSGSVVIDSGDLQLAHQNALGEVSGITMQNEGKISFLTEILRVNPSAEESAGLVTLGSGDQTLFVESGVTVSLDDVSFVGAGNLVKSGGGQLNYFDLANTGVGALTYTGATKVLAGELNLYVGAMQTSQVTCSSTGFSNLCSEASVSIENVYQIAGSFIDSNLMSPGDALITTFDESSSNYFEPMPANNAEFESSAENLAIETNFPFGENGQEERLIGSIVLAQFTELISPASELASPPALYALEPGSEAGGWSGVADFFGVEPRSDDGGGNSLGMSPPEGEGDGLGGSSVDGYSEFKAVLEDIDPAGWVPSSLSGEGYEVSLLLESAFQLLDAGNPSEGPSADALPLGTVPDGFDGSAVDTPSSQLKASTAVVADGSAALISDGSEIGSTGADVADGGESSVPIAVVAEEGSNSEAGAEAGDGAVSEMAEAVDEAGDGGEEGESVANEAGVDEEAGGDGENTGRGEGGTSEEPKAPSAAVAIKRVDAKQATENLAQGDAKSTSRTLQGLNLPDLAARRTPTPAAIVNSLQQVRQRITSGAAPR
jgi:filamentous hemagglutinin family protein